MVDVNRSGGKKCECANCRAAPELQRANELGRKMDRARMSLVFTPEMEDEYRKHREATNANVDECNVYNAKALMVALSGGEFEEMPEGVAREAKRLADWAVSFLDRFEAYIAEPGVGAESARRMAMVEMMARMGENVDRRRRMAQADMLKIPPELMVELAYAGRRVDEALNKFNANGLCGAK